jgi:16S rRNA (cytosine1402-N4)-methyltransferase
MTEYHTPVLLNECIEGLNIDPDGVYVDLTFGSGGHSREILKKIKGGKLVSFDQDEQAEQNVMQDERFVFVQGNFRFFKNFLKYLGINKVHGILADLGVSSHHFDQADRGFSFRNDGPLDMRMNPLSKQTAADLVNSMPQDELAKLFYEFGELSNGRQVASLISRARMAKRLETTFELCDALLPATPRNNEYKFFAKVFQALRMEVNQEIQALREMLSQSPEILHPKGRMVILTYHSLEDRDVKNFFRSGNFEGKIESDVYGRISGLPFKLINKKVVVPDENEIINNSRARSAKLRIAERNG